MADLAPFEGLRYSDSALDTPAVLAPPYDVLNDDERDTLLERNPHNVVAIDLPVAPSVMAAGGGVASDYRDAGDRFRQWCADGVLRRDPASLYVHRMNWICDGQERSTTGVIGALALPSENSSLGGPTLTPLDILPHEQTTPKASTDRLELTRATRANLSPIWVLTPSPGFAGLLHPTGDPVLDTHLGGTRHRLWVISSEVEITRISTALSDHPVVVADGHHRLGVALAYREESVGNGSQVGGADRVLALVTELVPDSVEIHGIHRLIRTWPTEADPIDVLGQWFTIANVDVSEHELVPLLETKDAMALITARGQWLLRARPELDLGTFDTDRLQHALNRIGASEIGYHHSEKFVRQEVAGGNAVAAVLVRPPTISQIMAVANGGTRMPPKSTFFSPKPPTGMVFRSLD